MEQVPDGARAIGDPRVAGGAAAEVALETPRAGGGVLAFVALSIVMALSMSTTRSASSATTAIATSVTTSGEHYGEAMLRISEDALRAFFDGNDGFHFEAASGVWPPKALAGKPCTAA